MNSNTIKRLDALWEKSVKGNLSDPAEDRSGDGKRAFMGSSGNDGWNDLRIEIDTDDCDSKIAIVSGQFIQALWNEWPEIRECLSRDVNPS